MEIKDLFKLLIIISTMILFFHILLTAPHAHKYAWIHTFINLGIIFINLIGEIIITLIEKG